MVSGPAHDAAIVESAHRADDDVCTCGVRRLCGAIVVVLAALLPASCSDPQPRPGTEGLFANADLWARMLAAEDARGAGSAGIAPLMEGMSHGDPSIRRMAVRALGRLERDSLGASIARLLGDVAPAVRAEAANALAQVTEPESVAAAESALRARLSAETQASVRGILAESLARLPHADSASVVRTIDTLGQLAAATPQDSTGDGVRLGVARGLYFLARQPAARGVTAQPAHAMLVSLATASRPDSLESIDAIRTRTVATAALVASGGATATDLIRIINDPDPYVRREAVAGLGVVMAGDTAASLVRSALDDPSPVVRYEALRVDARVNGGTRCASALNATADADMHVALLAIDRLATGCAGTSALVLLDSIASTLPAPDAPSPGEWHRPAQAAVALAALDPARALPHIELLEQSDNPFVRMRAARAATLTASPATLRRLAGDDVPNVRTEAVIGLSRVSGHAADDVYIAQLREGEDNQLIREAASALAGTADSTAIDALFTALERMTARGRDTERDSRVAIINRIAALGDSSDAPRLSRRLDDYDPRIAELAATTVERWTGRRPETDVRRLVADSLPTLEETAALDGARVTVLMEDGTRINAILLAFEAPTNVWRFARLARDGYYDGLTFHRVAPNFVIQGGSPNANEYSGDGPFSRDEIGLPGNWRGTIGLSTRGRDTGDAQIFINLVDNVRLDHEYTVFGVVISDLDAIQHIIEGDVIRKITISS